MTWLKIQIFKNNKSIILIYFSVVLVLNNINQKLTLQFTFAGSQMLKVSSFFVGVLQMMQMTLNAFNNGIYLPPFPTTCRIRPSQSCYHGD